MLSRRAFFALSAASATCLALPGAAQTQTLYVVDTDDGYLNLRSGPGSTHGVILRMTAGTRLAALGRDGQLRRVALPDGTTGWAHRAYLNTQYSPTRNYDLMVGYTDDGYLNLRSGPGTNHGILRRLHAGQRLWIETYSGNWAQVRLPEGTIGWAALRYLEAV